MPRVLLALIVSTLGGGTPSHPATNPAPEIRSCQPCHQRIVATFLETAHFRTSAEATARSVTARFSEGHNVLRTGAAGIYFRMERRNDVFYQTGVDSGKGTSRAERIDIVIGSGRRGQSYLYWRNGLLFELPVSYLTGIGRWINSPGYPDGQIDFGRLIVPRCLECHSTSFTLRTDRGAVRYSRPYVLGLSCEKCHGDARAHVSYQSAHPADTAGKYILNPARFSRDRHVDNCALCHSGERDPRRPPFSYRPGEKLDDYLVRPSAQDVPIPDVHGNQVELLRRSRCFRASPDLSCSTCHDVHAPQRDVAWFAQKCLACHETHQHPMADQLGERLVGWCIDCHMPNRKSKALEINTPTQRVALRFRTHAIGIYAEAAAAVLKSHGVEPPR
jgi:hypothetical protein